MASRKLLAPAISSLLLSIDLDTPAPSTAADKSRTEPEVKPPQHQADLHITDIIGDLSLDLD